MTFVVGFSGCSCSGKSTTIKEVKKMLEKKGCSVYLVPEVAREELLKNNLNVLQVRRRGKYYNFEKTIFVKHVHEILNAVKEYYDVVLTDRTVYDIMAYCILYGEYLTNDEARKLFNAFEFFTHVYDKIYVFEPVKNREKLYDDGVRSGEVTPYVFNKLLTILMKSYNFLLVDFVDYDTVENRAKTITNDIMGNIHILRGELE